MNKKKEIGFTLIEIIIVVMILLILAAIVTPDFLSIRKRTDVDNNTKEFAQILSLTRSKTLASEADKKYGVYLDSASTPNRYVLFQGTSYALREPSADQIYFLPQNMEFYGINLTKMADGSSSSEVVFSKPSGISEDQGSISIRIKTDLSYSKTVYISSSGAVGFDQAQSPDDENRVKDTRQVKFNYNRTTDPVNENIVLNFNNGAVLYAVEINKYLVSGELDWEGAVEVGGADQKIRIHTEGLGTSGTIFNVRRDRRYNNASLKITISDDTGSLIEYSVDGSEINHTSIYVDEIEWL